MHLGDIGYVLGIALIWLELAVMTSLAANAAWSRLILKSLVYFLLWALLVAPLTVRVLSSVPIPGYSTAAQTLDFVLALPLQLWAVRVAYAVLRLADHAMWRAGRWVLLRGLGVDSAEVSAAGR